MKDPKTVFLDTFNEALRSREADHTSSRRYSAVKDQQYRRARRRQLKKLVELTIDMLHRSTRICDCRSFSLKSKHHLFTFELDGKHFEMCPIDLVLAWTRLQLAGRIAEVPANELIIMSLARQGE